MIKETLGSKAKQDIYINQPSHNSLGSGKKSCPNLTFTGSEGLKNKALDSKLSKNNLLNDQNMDNAKLSDLILGNIPSQKNSLKNPQKSNKNSAIIEEQYIECSMNQLEDTPIPSKNSHLDHRAASKFSKTNISYEQQFSQKKNSLSEEELRHRRQSRQSMINTEGLVEEEDLSSSLLEKNNGSCKKIILFVIFLLLICGFGYLQWNFRILEQKFKQQKEDSELIDSFQTKQEGENAFKNDLNDESLNDFKLPVQQFKEDTCDSDSMEPEESNSEEQQVDTQIKENVQPPIEEKYIDSLNHKHIINLDNIGQL